MIQGKKEIHIVEKREEEINKVKHFLKIILYKMKKHKNKTVFKIQIEDQKQTEYQKEVFPNQLHLINRKMSIQIKNQICNKQQIEYNNQKNKEQI